MTQPSEHRESATVLLGEIPAQLAGLREEYNACLHRVTVSPRFRALTLSFLVNLRAVLDYLAHDLIPFLSKTPSKLYFPIAGRGLPESKFEETLKKKWLPGLDARRPDIFSFLMGLQHFQPGNEWITAFSELSNRNKHVRLSKMTMGDCEATVVRLHGHPVMQLGARGFAKWVINGPVALTFRDKSGKEFSIRGPQTLDRDTTLLHDADAGLDVVRAAWTEFKFDEFPPQPAIVFLEIAEREVRAIARQLAILL